MAETSYKVYKDTVAEVEEPDQTDGFQKLGNKESFRQPYQKL